MQIKSEYNTLITLSELVNGAEGQTFDRKSAAIKVADLAAPISAFANANGGVIAIGVRDDGTIEGVNQLGTEKINNLVNAPNDICHPMPLFKHEFLDVVDSSGEPNRILLLHIEVSPSQLVKTVKDEVYLRIGDRSKLMKGDDLRNLEYAKSDRHFEDEINFRATLDDLDEELLSDYKRNIGAEDLPSGQVLRARGLCINTDEGVRLTNAAVLLFAKNIRQFYPNCRVRFVRYDGSHAQYGTSINITKDVSLDFPLLKLLSVAKDFIASQLREFTSLNTETGRFEQVPEYPEFAWLEGLVNAVVHREYALMGDHIRVFMFEDRLQIESPGRFAGPVTPRNILTTRFSRNPLISRVLNECGYVRELNEGVPRMFNDMKGFFLEDPKYENREGSVRLVLKNNIVMRRIRREERIQNSITPALWRSLEELEKSMLHVLGSRKYVTTSQMSELMDKSKGTVIRHLNKLQTLGVVVRHGHAGDTTTCYELANV